MFKLRFANSGIEEEPIDEIRRFYVTWTLILFAIQLTFVLGSVIYFSRIDAFRLNERISLIQSNALPPESIESLKPMINSNVIMTLIAGTVTQAGAAYYFLATKLFNDSA